MVTRIAMFQAPPSQCLSKANNKLTSPFNTSFQVSGTRTDAL